IVERHNIPEVEACKMPKVILMTLYITRLPLEYVWIKSSIDSIRPIVKIKHEDDIEHILARGMTRVLNLRFMKYINWEISEMKLSLDTRARIVAESFLGHVV
ncbi:hypothetical protein BY996DRAFT_4577439, partial [Phakopsora pachyrhizi]